MPKTAAAAAIGKHMLALVALAAAIVVLAGPALAAPEAELWERWTRHDETSDRSVDHSVWDSLLKRYVTGHEDGVARVSYSTFSEADEAGLLSYIKQLEAVPVSSLNRAEQFAYWVNLYNAVTVALIVQAYPVETIRDIDISPGFFSDGPWGKKLVEVEGERVSLDDIEHRILRPIWKDPRIHYAVNCASIGCPDLWPEALTAANTEAYLDRAARVYVNHPRGASIENGRLYVSSIYSWFEADFGGSEAGVIDHLRLYADAGLKAGLASVESISGDRYDWSLNSLKPVPKTAKNKNISPGS
ncbi:MAG: DUF547 domain-containing protein [Alphaproteobacteria bacterium]